MTCSFRSTAALMVDLLRNEKVCCQFLSYANGHVWVNIRTGAVRAR